jgi:hypothetical protein
MCFVDKSGGRGREIKVNFRFLVPCISSTYVYKYPKRWNNGISFYYKITVHVSGTLRAHHQEYINCS